MYDKAELFVKEGGALNLSTAALCAFLRAVLSKGVSFRFRAKGFSMSPCISDGDVVTVAPLSGRALRLGDTVAFINLHADKLAVHRIVGRQGDAFLVKGDNAPAADGLIRRADILGRVIGVERGGRRVSLGLGPEKLAIALLNRYGILMTLLILLSRARSVLRCRSGT